VTPQRPESNVLRRSAVPTNLPVGWEYGKVFGEFPPTGTAGALHLIMGLSALLLAIAFGFCARRLA
jgi:hypothetical protein